MRGLEILDSPAEEVFDGLVKLLATICETPMAMLTLVDEERQWFKAMVGFDATETSREVSFCSHTIEQSDGYMEVNDATADPRFASNPFVTEDVKVRFYAGSSVIAFGDNRIGALCVVDTRPRQLSAFQRTAFVALRRQAEALLAARLSALRLERIETAHRRRTAALVHDVRNPLSAVTGNLSFLKSNPDLPQDEIVQLAADSLSASTRCIELLDHALKPAATPSPVGSNEVVELDVVLKKMVRLYRHRAITRQQTLTSADAPGEVVVTDEPTLKRILENLIANVLAYTPAGGTVHLQANHSRLGTEIWVTDSGPGVPREARERIFHERVRLPGTESQPGHGIGLSSVRELCTQVGAVCSVTDAPGGGARFIVRFETQPA